MLRSHITAALRNLARNKLYACLNIMGLAIGFAAALIIAVYVRYELSYDRFIPGYPLVFRASTSMTMPGGSPFAIDGVSNEVAAWLKLDMPGLDSVARISSAQVMLRQGQIENSETLYWADPTFFYVMPLPSLAGDPTAALADPNGLVITRRIARKYFGTDAPIGKTLQANGHWLRVAAVLEDLPPNTHLNTEIFGSGLASFSSLAIYDSKASHERESVTEGFSYFRMKSPASLRKLDEQLGASMTRHMGKEQTDVFHVKAVPLADIHFQDAGPDAMKPAGDRLATYAVAVSGILILSLACINFINLMTAMAGLRAIEVGVRKVAGAGQSRLMTQFVGESLLLVITAASIALSLVELLLPQINAFLGTALEFSPSREPRFAAVVIGGVLCMGSIAALYPAFVLANFRPTQVFAGKTSTATGSTLLRKLLVIFQFAALIGVTLTALIVNRQLSYATENRMRLDHDAVLLISQGCKGAFKNAVESLPGVRNTTCALSAPLNLNISSTMVNLANGSQTTLYDSWVDYNFFSFFGLKPIAGRLFSSEYGADAAAGSARTIPVVLNETGVRALGFTSPSAAIGQTYRTSPETTFSIIGVVPDFHVTSIREKVLPTDYMVDQQRLELLSVKLAGQAIPDTITKIDALWKQQGQQQPIRRLFYSEYIESLYKDTTRQSKLFGVFTGLASLLACMGLFGLSAFTAARRTKEIGIRKSMGAGTGEVMQLLMWQFAKPVLWATLIAWPVAGFCMNRWLQGFAYHVAPSPWLFLGVTTLALTVSLLTVSVHCYLVARAKPVAALRYE
ncbi:MAG: ABC transporter permease [Steroidobacteraceae bacterium]